MAADLTGATLLSRTREQRDFPIPSQPEVRVGYDRSNDVAVPFEGVSRRHARISFDGKEYWIEDVGSANGTYLNAVRLTQRERLKHLDVVTLGRRADLIFVRRAVEVARKAKEGILSARLEILDGLDAGTKREIPRGSVTIGRSAGNNIVADSQLVSKVHARIERSGVELVLTDLQSANGTFVNGDRIESRVLKDGDEISVGHARSYRVRFEKGEVLTGDVAVSSTSSNPSLPLDWRTHMEWSPEEVAQFDKARAKLRPSAPGATDKQPAAKGEAAPAPRAAEKAAREEKKAAPPVAEVKAAAAPKAQPEAPKPAAKAEVPKAATPPAPPPAAPQPAPKPAPPTPPVTPKPAPAAAEAKPPAPTEKQPPPAPPTPSVTPKPAPHATEAKPAPPAPAAAEAKPAPPAPEPPPPAAKPQASPEPSPPRSPIRAPEAPRDASATRALTPDQLPKIFLENPARTFPLALGTWAIGRDPVADVRLEGSEISRHHAKLTVTEQAATLEDLRTVNGTYVNRQKIAAPRALADGDEVTFGSLRFKVRFAAGFPKA